MYHQVTRLRTGVVVTAVHPVLGRLFWCFVDESSVNGNDYYGFTAHIERAVLLDRNWRTSRYDSSRHQNHVSWAINQLERDEDMWYEKSGQSKKEFYAWLKSADWYDMPVPARAEYLVDLGYFYEWESYTPDIPTEFASNFDAFAVALSVRFHWMDSVCLRGIGLNCRAEAAQSKAEVALNILAQHEAIMGYRYRGSAPLVLSDVPELVQDYEDMYAYWSGRLASQS